MNVSPSAIAARLLKTRWVVRAPIWLFRAGLGWGLGSQLVMLEHRGRASGHSRYVCLEVVERPAPDQIVIVSGFGESAQWYQNLRTDPRCFVWSGRIRRARARAEFLTEAQSRDALDHYRRHRPRDWAILRAVIEQAVGHPVEALPMVRLNLIAPRPR